VNAPGVASATQIGIEHVKAVDRPFQTRRVRKITGKRHVRGIPPVLPEGDDRDRCDEPNDRSSLARTLRVGRVVFGLPRSRRRRRTPDRLWRGGDACLMVAVERNRTCPQRAAARGVGESRVAGQKAPGRRSSEAGGDSATKEGPPRKATRRTPSVAPPISPCGGPSVSHGLPPWKSLFGGREPPLEGAARAVPASSRPAAVLTAG
jgi:hypothetical protein